MNSFLITLLFVMGVFLPTSTNSTINTTYPLIYTIIIASVFLYLIIRFKTIKLNLFFIALGINILILASTLFSPFFTYALGLYPSYLAITLLFCVDFKKIKFSPINEKAFTITSVVTAIICIMIAHGNVIVNTIITNHYSAIYQELVSFMISLDKPVFTFASHSIAGFFFYLFFFMNFQKYKLTNSLYSLVISLCFIYLMAMLKSNTAYFFLIIAVIDVLYRLFMHKKLWFGIILCSFLIYIGLNFDLVKEWFYELSFNFSQVTSSDTNGLIGRFGNTGNLSNNINYIKSNPFSPIGITTSPELTNGDSAIIEYLMRGTLVLVILMYTGLYLFLKKNLINRRVAISFFLIILSFDIGYNSLTYFRTLFILPLLIVMLNKWEIRKIAA